MMEIYNFKELGFKLPEGSGLVKADQAKELSDANNIIIAAQAHGAGIIDDAKTHFESERARGYREGRAAAEAEALERLLKEHALLDQRLSGIEDSLGKLVVASVREVIASYSDSDQAEALVRGALHKVRRENRVQIHAPEALMNDLGDRVDKLKATFPKIETIELLENPMLRAPNIIIETAVGRIDCDMGDKLDAVETIITQVAKNRSADKAAQPLTPDE